MNPLEVHDARKRFGDIVALDGVSVALRAGELLALLGPNGAGKTTLVRAIAGRVRLDAGDISLDGRPLDDEGRRALGVVPQEVAVYPLLTARENLEVFGSLNGLSGRALREAVAWALDWTALEGRQREPAKRFSGGMRRRLNIACGVLHRPRVVLLDEPTVGVDPQSRERIYEMLAGLKRAGASLLLTTHHLEEAEARCDRIVIIDHGRTVAAGTLSELTAATFGEHHEATAVVNHLPEPALEGLEAHADTMTVRALLRDLDADLPALLARLRAAGCEVVDLQVRRPSLAGVFLKLTGKELRE
ncbi:MAG: ABC transporter ATP-binding protein [Acidobacteria bacterium]|nr:ABC transporter ATP-binding protein [Acidobacteriota bacterium]